MLLFIFVPKILHYKKAKANPTSTKNAIKSSLGISQVSSINFAGGSQPSSEFEIAKSIQMSSNTSSSEPCQDGQVKESTRYLGREEVEHKKRDEEIDAKLGRLEDHITNGVLNKLEKKDGGDDSEALVVVDSPEIRETLRKEKKKKKKALAQLRRQIVIMRANANGQYNAVEQAPPDGIIEDDEMSRGSSNHKIILPTGEVQSNP